MHFLAALKKAKKNVRRIFDSPEAKLIHSYLSSPVVKEITQVFDILSLSHHTPVKDEDLSSTVQGTVEALRAGPLSVDQNDIEANELIQLLQSIHFNAFVETYTEIATKRFHMPELPDSAFYAASGLGTYGTMGSLAASCGQIAPSIRLSNGDLLNGASDPSLLNAYSTSRPNLPPPGSAPGYIDLRKTEATLTGGGVGPALPPVEGTMKIISFEKNLGEDLGITIVQQPYVSAHYGLVKELVVKRILTASRIEQQGLLHEGDVIREANGVPVDNPQVLQRLLRNATGTVTLKIIPGYQSTPLTSQLFLRAYFTYNPKNDNLIPCKEAGLPFEAGSVLQVLKQEDPHWWQFGEYEGHYYGTKLDSIRQVVATGRTCLLTCNVQVVPKIRNSEFMPFVVFLAAPSVSCMKAMYEYGMSMRFTDKWKRDENFRHTLEASKHIEQNYRHLLDMIMLCDNIEANFERLSQALNDLLTQPQWVPARWLY
ncbi:MAGUK p55 subfamily member 2 [Fasciola gigantica]|uniref:MAGUK p55 subfamily member 2 n=1 Tax=Fasciola gigantica TaxID=46835 RepID=A0A504YEJ9_FASGI|nr:MAGUK p55 subfamily member 2 [Fasciola gigantica]